MNEQALAAGGSIHPLTGDPRTPRTAKPRIELNEAMAKFLAQRNGGRRINATYDAARDSDDFKNYWANADNFDADSANSQPVRQKLVSRSRYEVANNGYADGIAQTYATHLVGKGPVLRMQTGSEKFNRMIEDQWYRWCKAIQFRRKFWCMAHAKHTDGEAIATVRRNPKVNHRIKLDIVLHETEQCRTPLLPYGVAGYIDGIKFDEFGNPEWYDILQEHPGSNNRVTFNLKAERVPAELVLHWFKLRRPGQHRGVPECASTLNTGAAARRWREATLAAAETAADFSVLLKTLFQPEDIQQVDPMSTLDVQKRQMTALPEGWGMEQLKAEHPTATYEAFHRQLVNEQARCKNMPYNVAACDSASYNYASGRLDHQTYYGSLDSDREDGNDMVLDRLFGIWFKSAVREFNWFGGDAELVNLSNLYHSWDWPKHGVADVESEANANQTKLKSGATNLSKLYSESGEDFEDEILKMSADFGVTPDEMRDILLSETYPNAAKQAVEQYGVAVRAGVITPQVEDEDALRKRMGLPPVSEAVKSTWTKDGGTRRPITLTTPSLIEDAASASSAPSSETEAPDAKE